MDGLILAGQAGDYTLETISDDGVRLWLDGRLVIDDWSDHAPAGDTVRLHWSAGSKHKLRIDYYQAGGGAQCAFDGPYRPHLVSLGVPRPPNRSTMCSITARTWTK